MVLRSKILGVLLLLVIVVLPSRLLSKTFEVKDQTNPDSIPYIPDSVFITRIDSIRSYIPLTYTPQVRAFINYYLCKRPEQVQRMVEDAAFFFPMFEEKLDAQGLPLELRFLPVIESALNPKAVSHAGAEGLWQFMKSTGRLYGLKVSSLVDERLDPVKSTDAAVNFLQDLYVRYGDWNLAIAAYNCGPGYVDRAIRRSGGHRDFISISKYLPRETRNYVPAFAAAVYVMTYHHVHGIAVPEVVEQPKELTIVETDTIKVKHKVELSKISNILNIKLDDLLMYNPQYKYSYIPAQASYDAMLRLPDSVVLRFIELGDSVYMPTEQIVDSSEKAGDSNLTCVRYRVKSGDNLSLIASWFGVSVSQLKTWNSRGGNMIYVGEHLKVYVPLSRRSHYEAINSMSYSQKQALRF